MERRVPSGWVAGVAASVVDGMVRCGFAARGWSCRKVGVENVGMSDEERGALLKGSGEVMDKTGGDRWLPGV
jgi:hypothetical protein